MSLEWTILVSILVVADKNIKSIISAMPPIKQENSLGCAVAATAFVLQVTYQQALELFVDGKRRVREEANFYCPEITSILNNSGLNYSWKKLLEDTEEIAIPNLSIIFVERSKLLPFGHFLARYNDRWMDPWINLPDQKIKAGFRKKLPGKPSYLIYPL